jgi:hypothetical protein
MTPQVINEAIAAFHTGWNPVTHLNSQVQDYYGDLNAIHEAEKKLIPELVSIYASYLFDLAVNLRIGNGKTFCMSGETLIHVATLGAPQRCEALLRTIGKWKEKQPTGGND